MKPITAAVGITGMNATDNPAPGVAVARSLRHEPTFAGKLIGLGYSALDPGFYAEGLLDAASVLPFPSAGKDALLQHLRTVQETFGLDVLVPNLDSELRAILGFEKELNALGIRTFLPSMEALERSSKAQLPKLTANPKIRVPDSDAFVTADAIPKLGQRLGFPLVIKGVYYGGDIVHTEADAVFAFHKYVATWGLPVIAQRYIAGEEYNVAAVGDGLGNTVGAVAMRKMALTDKGKGWSGVTVDNPELLTLAEEVVRELRWRGPLEVEVLREHDTGVLEVIEINPRFPAWIYLAAGAGQNLPYYVVCLALGLPIPKPAPRYRVGTLFVRISLDQIAQLETYGQLSATGNISYEKKVQP
ncbi:MAG: ATP-grasp domain-containing protein [Myxococcales bacterium]